MNQEVGRNGKKLGRNGKKTCKFRTFTSENSLENDVSLWSYVNQVENHGSSESS